MSFRDDYASMLRSMLSPGWQKPSERKIEVLLKKIEDGGHAEKPETRLPSEQSPSNRRRLTALVAAGTKLDAASRLAKEAQVDIASSGLFPVEMREDVQKITTEIDRLIKRLTSAIELIP